MRQNFRRFKRERIVFIRANRVFASSKAQEQRRAIRNGKNEQVTEEAFLVKTSKGKTKISSGHCKKHRHEENDWCHEVTPHVS